MNISAPFIKRPVGTSLLTAALLLAGILAFNFLPVAPLPQVEFPVISVGAGLPGASPETMASAVATPLERQFGRIAGVNEMTSTSQLGSTGITLQFDLNRNIDAAARDVQAAINAARSQLPANLPGNPTYRKVNPADAPVLILALTSDIITVAAACTTPPTPSWRRSWRRSKASARFRRGRRAARGARRGESHAAEQAGHRPGHGAHGAGIRQREPGQRATVDDRINAWTLSANDQIFTADQYRPLIVAYSNGGAGALGRRRRRAGFGRRHPQHGALQRQARVLIIIFRQPGANIIDTVDRVRAAAAAAASLHLSGHRHRGRDGPHHHDARLGARHRAHAADLDRPGHSGCVRFSADSARHHDSQHRRALSLVGHSA